VLVQIGVSGAVFPGWLERFGWLFEPLGRAGVAQLVEHLICNQRVGGSNPFASSTLKGSFGTERQWKFEPAWEVLTPGLS
jgi:hypothetical protein